MAAKDALNRNLFHGTGGEVTGGVVKPGEEHAHGYGAYATTGMVTAQAYAGTRAIQEGRLFGTVYKVRPMSKSPKVRDMGGNNETYVIDPKGLEVVEAVDFPVNVDALHKSSRWD